MNVKKSKGVMGYILVELRKSEMQPGRRIVGGNLFPQMSLNRGIGEKAIIGMGVILFMRTRGTIENH
ncbi:MAG: hypothetical protein ACFNOM_04650 [Parascardovia denticolens]